MKKKGYTDFVSDMSRDPGLGRQMVAAAPFDSAQTLLRWFLDRGYEIKETQAEELFESQGDLIANDDPLEY